MTETDTARLLAFIRESNAIEGIHRKPSDDEIATAERFLKLDRIELADVDNFVAVYQPGAVLRDQPGLDVHVGEYVAPPGGQDIRAGLEELLADIVTSPPIHWTAQSPWAIHLRYERLHPFTDGNGRSGRMIWLWQMCRVLGELPTLSFLHQWYYSSLSEGRLT